VGRVKDEEYLGGVMGLSQDLSRWVQRIHPLAESPRSSIPY
jgi:hypothetical protein